MAKKEKASREEKRAAADYYKLHSQAVDDLIHADGRVEHGVHVPLFVSTIFRNQPRLPDRRDGAFKGDDEMLLRTH